MLSKYTSIDQIRWVMTEAPTTTSMEQSVMLSIAYHDGDGGSWPSVRTIAHECRCSERTVQYTLRRLVERGLLVIHENAGGTHQTPGGYRPNRYEILRGATRCTPPDQLVEEPPGVQLTTDRGATDDLEGCNLRPTGVQTSAPELPMNFPEQPENSPTMAASRERDVLFESVCAVCKIDWSKLTPSGRGPLVKAVAELRGVHADPREVVERAMHYKLRYPDIELTPSALAKHWAALSEPPVTMSKRQVGNKLALAQAASRRNQKEITR